MRAICAMLFIGQAFVFAAAVGVGIGEHAKGVVIGVLLALANLCGFVIEAHLWLRPRPREL